MWVWVWVWVWVGGRVLRLSTNLPAPGTHPSERPQPTLLASVQSPREASVEAREASLEARETSTEAREASREARG